ncbi:kunitz-like toxin PcKuz3 [Physella acuta]|uniref:kunitz-like toxin PcKuz3 n=1 Tax=Physella acuta TaxID=109671 RepID=UPI0027DE433B|nr:kunitz-like toxin PcKuz3 [Physella acuta]
MMTKLAICLFAMLFIQLSLQQTTPTPVDCTLAPEPGQCKLYVEQYYFDTTTHNCQPFIYGGCGGNSNKFDTLEECENRCGIIHK